MITMKTTGRVHEESEKELLEFMTQKCEEIYISQGGAFSLPTFPVEVNVKNRQLDDLSEFVTGVKEKIGENPLLPIMQKFEDQFDKVILLSVLVGLSLLLSNGKCLKLKMLYVFLLHVIVIYYIFNDDSKLMDYIPLLGEPELIVRDDGVNRETEFDEGEIVPEFQFSLDTLPVWSSAILMALHTTVGLKPRTDFVRTLLNLTKISDAQRSNVTSIIVKISNNLSTLLNKIVGEGSISKFFYIETVSDTDVLDYQEQCERFIATCNTGAGLGREWTKDRFRQLMQRGNVLLKNVARESYDKRCIETCMTRLSNLNACDIGFSTSLNDKRVEPVGVLLKGDPGFGKTVLSHRLAEALLYATIPDSLLEEAERNPSNYLHVKSSDKFFDGMPASTYITRYDDIFCNRDTASSTDTDAQQIIKMINSAPYCVKMAQADAKNTVYFRSRAVLATTNLVDFKNLESVTDFRAVKRRFHYNVTVRVNPKYVDNENSAGRWLPTTQIEYEGVILDETYYPDDFWVLEVEMTTQGMASHCVVMDFDTLVVSIRDEMQRRERQFYINKMVDGRVKRRFRCTTPSMPSSRNDTPFSQSGYFSPGASVCSSSGISSTQLEGFYMAYLELIESFKGKLDGYKHLTLANIKTLLSFYGHNFPISGSNLEEVLGELSIIFTAIHDGSDVVFGTMGLLCRESVIGIASNKILEYARNISHFLRRNLAILGFVVMAVSPLYKLIKCIFRFFFPVDEETPSKNIVRSKKLPGNPLSLQQFDMSYSPHSYVVQGVSISSLPKLESSDFGPRNCATDVIAKCFNSYVFTLFYAFQRENREIEYFRIGLVHNLKGDIFMMNFHFVAQLIALMKKPDYKGSVVILTTATKSCVYEMSDLDFLDGVSLKSNTATENDLILVRVKRAQRQSVGLIRYVVSETELQKYKGLARWNCNLLGIRNKTLDGSSILIKSSSVQIKRTSVMVPVKASWTGKEEVYGLEDTFSYIGTNFGSGDCGSLLCLPDLGSNNGLILGLHAAGSTDMGFAITLSKEKLEKILSESSLGEVNPYVEDDVNLDLKMYDISAQGAVAPWGSIGQRYTSMSPECSVITKSVLYNKLSPDYPVSVKTVSKLKSFVGEDGKLIHPHVECMANFGKITPQIPELFVDGAVSSYRELIDRYMNVPRDSRVVLTLEQALETYGKLKKIDPNTSAGFPHNTPSGVNLKKDYITALRSGDNVRSAECLERIRDSVNKNLVQIRNGIRPPNFLYTGNLKDEKVSRKKAKAGMSRFFLGSPYEMLILFRMYFGAFMDAYCDANLLVGSAIGVNPFSENWDMLARNLLRHSVSSKEETVGAGDFKGFDGSEAPVILNRVLDIIQEWYGNKDIDAKLIRSRLWAEITNARFVFKGEFYVWFTAMPSGNPATAMINTMYNNLVFRVAWQLAGHSWKLFNDNCYMIALGDDNCFTVRGEYRDTFNELRMPELMEMCGMVYTTELKGAAEKRFRSIEEVEFLKRGFRYVATRGRWVAPLREESILEAIYWSKKGKLKNQITLDNLMNGVREMSLHGEDRFNLIFNKVPDLKDSYLMDVDSNIILPSGYEQVLDAVLASEDSYYF